MSRSPDEERRPAGNGTAIENTGGRSSSILPRVSVDLLALTPEQRTVWDTAYLSGYLAGHEAGVQWADDRAATLHREAVRIVHRMARLPEAPPPSPHREAERQRLMGRSA